MARKGGNGKEEALGLPEGLKISSFSHRSISAASRLRKGFLKRNRRFLVAANSWQRPKTFSNTVWYNSQGRVLLAYAKVERDGASRKPKCASFPIAEANPPHISRRKFASEEKIGAKLVFLMAL